MSNYRSTMFARSDARNVSERAQEIADMFSPSDRIDVAEIILDEMREWAEGYIEEHGGGQPVCSSCGDAITEEEADSMMGRCSECYLTADIPPST